MQDIYALNPKMLSFGLMRLPCIGNQLDMPQFCDMVDLFLARGGAYFDTAYPYHDGKSEMAVKTALVERHPRESFTLADKMPLWVCKEPADLRKTFDIQLERTGAGYFDFYLLHALATDRAAKAETLGAWRFMQEMKAQGLVRHIGFSFHDTADVLDAILTAHPETEFVQLQINYADWDSDSVQSRLCYETARRHGKPVIIMEPIKGGSLAEPESVGAQVLAAANPDMSAAEWALRFVGALDGVMAVLSGMSTLEQVEQNLAVFENLQPLTESENAVLKQAVAASQAVDTVPCTSCGYCLSVCPQDIQTPGMIRLLNNYRQFQYLPPVKSSYSVILREHPRAAACIQCGACESVCPQNIPIIDTLQTISKLLDEE